MKTPLAACLLLVNSFFPILVPALAFAQPKGHVHVTLEWHSHKQVYTYVFTGVVSHQGRPCANAKIHLELSDPDRRELAQDVITKEDGSYSITVALKGIPHQAADWKLVAVGPDTRTQMSEIEGRTVLMEANDPVVVQRPIQLIQG
jgi:hypothetical protein